MSLLLPIYFISLRPLEESFPYRRITLKSCSFCFAHSVKIVFVLLTQQLHKEAHSQSWASFRLKAVSSLIIFKYSVNASFIFLNYSFATLFQLFFFCFVNFLLLHFQSGKLCKCQLNLCFLDLIWF